MSVMQTNAVAYDWPLILAYHSVSSYRRDGLAVRTADFADQMAWLQQHGYHAVTLGEFATQQFERRERIVIITFDDGYADNYREAWPVLKRYGYVATIFLVADYVDTDQIFPWDQPKIATPAERSHFGVLSWAQVQEMAATGIEFGSHTSTHPELTQIPLAQRRDEIVRSRRDLQAKLGTEVATFCYPRGKLDEETIQLVAEAGYRCAVVSPKRAGIPLNPYTLRRIGIYYSTNRWLFRLKATPLVRLHYERWLGLRGKR
jgi:peptidoglycan/xylan/chitin deacetylase (PgdA/CDA1 family)